MLYNRLMPVAQARFLSLLDYLGVPHEDPKQQHGVSLEIIGSLVDISSLSIKMLPASKNCLVAAIWEFVNEPPFPRQQTTRAWLRILGHANWALNVFPLLKPALNSSYNKVAGRKFMNARIFINKQTREDLLWFVDQVEQLEGVHIFGA